MSDSEAGGHRPDQDRSTLPDWAVGLLAIEGVALLIGLAMPITPSKTGSTWSPAELIWPEPTYLQDVAVYFVMTNALVAVIGSGVWAWSKVVGGRRS